MGNRAIVTTKDRKVGIYVHWHEGANSIRAFLKYAKLCNFGLPENNDYGWSRLAQIITNFFDDLDKPSDGLSVGILTDITDEWAGGADNGIYIIKNWEIVDRIRTHSPYVDEKENKEYIYGIMMRINERMPYHFPAEEIKKAVFDS